MKKLRIRYPQAVNPETFDVAAHAETAPGALVEAILLTSEICGQLLSPAAAHILAGDLADFDETAILGALARCRIEVHGRLKVVDIIVRIADGRPDAEEAWHMLPMDEMTSTVWTEEIAHAWGVASPLLEAGEIAAARPHSAKAMQRRCSRPASGASRCAGCLRWAATCGAARRWYWTRSARVA